MKRYQDPHDPLNSAAYHTGKPCIEPGCTNPAGTHWSPLWCQPCNVTRMDRIGSQLRGVVERLEGEDENKIVEQEQRQVFELKEQLAQTQHDVEVMKKWEEETHRLVKILANTEADLREAKQEMARLQTWDGLMETLDRIYPEQICSGISGDTGPTIICLLRLIHRLLKE